MRIIRMVLVSIVAGMLAAGVAHAGDFEWMKDFNVKMQADPSGFKASLATRFKIGDAQLNAVIGSTANPADAYMVFRLGEMSKKPPETVMAQYQAGKGQGWGNLAKSLGIKPGSPEFHALKRGHDLDGGSDPGHGKGKGKKDKKHKKNQ